METKPNALKVKIKLPQQECSSDMNNVEKRIRSLIGMGGIFGQSLTDSVMDLYVQAMTDLTDEQFSEAIGRAIRECKFFPRPAELREMAGVSSSTIRKVEAEAAWNFVNKFLQKYGVVDYGDRPPLSPRLDYALRRIGGLNGLNQITEQSRPFMFRDFCEGYEQAPVSDMMLPQLDGMFGKHRMLPAPRAKQLAGTVEAAQPEPTRPACKPQKIPEPPTDTQLCDRREMLRQQLEKIKKQGAYA